MKLTTLPALALAASCAANAPDIKSSNVDLHTAQTRDALLAQLDADHEGLQDNGDFVYCTSITTSGIQKSVDEGLVTTDLLVEHLLKDEAKNYGVAEAGFNACDHVLNAGDNDKCWFTSIYDLKLKKNKGIFSTTTYCDENHSVETTCTASVPIKAIIANPNDACVRVGTPENVSIEQLPPLSNTPVFLQ